MWEHMCSLRTYVFSHTANKLSHWFTDLHLVAPEHKPKHKPICLLPGHCSLPLSLILFALGFWLESQALCALHCTTRAHVPCYDESRPSPSLHFPLSPSAHVLPCLSSIWLPFCLFLSLGASTEVESSPTLWTRAAFHVRVNSGSESLCWLMHGVGMGLERHLMPRLVYLELEFDENW